MGTDKRARQKELHRTRAEQARKAAEAKARRRRFVNITVVLVVLALVVGFSAFFFSSDDTTASDSTTTTAAAATTTLPGATTVTALAEGTTPCPNADGSSEKKQSFDGPPKMCIDPTKTYTAKVETNEGDFTLTLDAAKAPKTVNNFVFLARYHYYDGIIFHRIIKDFMIQGGDPEGTGTGGPGYEFADELPQQGEYQMYSVAMANAGANTNGSQFFIITGPQGVSLPPSYSLFGKATEGTDVIDKIGKVQTGSDDKPTSPVTMKKVTITES
ncbi:MAG: peptidylprolyl isomerase [Acidimicrobiales bacterium]